MLTEEERKRFAESSHRQSSSGVSAIFGARKACTLPTLKPARGSDCGLLPDPASPLTKATSSRKLPGQLIEELRQSLDLGSDARPSTANQVVTVQQECHSPVTRCSSTGPSHRPHPALLRSESPSLPRLSSSGLRCTLDLSALSPAPPKSTGQLGIEQPGPGSPVRVSQSGRTTLSGVLTDLPAYLLQRPGTSSQGAADSPGSPQSVGGRSSMSPSPFQQGFSDGRSSASGSRLAAALRSTGRVSGTGEALGQSAARGEMQSFASEPVARRSLSGNVGFSGGSGSRLKVPTMDGPLALGELAVAMGVVAPADKKLAMKNVNRSRLSSQIDTVSPVPEPPQGGLARFKSAGAAIIKQLKLEPDELEDFGDSRSCPVPTSNDSAAAPEVSRVHELLHPASVRALVNLLQDQVLKNRAAMGMTNATSSGGLGNPGARNKNSGKMAAVGFDGLSDAEVLAAPANLHRVYHTGVSIKTVLRLASLLPPGPITTEKVAKEHLMPLTQRYSAKLVDLIPQQAVNMPKAYVIHAWSADFHGLADSLKRYCNDTGQDPSSTYVFLDLFCCNMGTRITPRDLGTIKDVINTCKDVVLVVDRQAVVFQRLWCVYEAWIACVGCKSFKSHDHLRLLLYSTDAVCLADSLQQLSSLKVHCSTAEDRAMLVEDMATVDHIGKITLPAMCAAVQEGILASSKAEVTKAASHVKSSPRRYVLALTKLGMLMKAAGQHWDAEKALRQILQLSTAQGKLINEDEITRHVAHLAECMLQRGFLDEAERLASQAQAYFEAVLMSEGLNAPCELHDKNMGMADLCTSPQEALISVLLIQAQVCVSRAQWERAEQILEQLLGKRCWEATQAQGADTEADEEGCAPGTPAALRSPQDNTSGGKLCLNSPRDRILVMRLMAELYYKSGRRVLAEKYLRAALDRARKTLGPSHLLVADLRMILAEWLHTRAARILDETESKLEQARKEVAQLYGPISSPRGDRSSASQRGETSAARELREAAAAASAAREGTQRDLYEAKELTEAALSTRQDLLGNDSVAALDAQVLLLHIGVSMDEHETVQPQLEQVLARCETVYGSSHVVSASAKEVAARLREHYLALGNAFSRKMDDARAEDQYRIAMYMNSLIGVSEFEEKQILRALQDVLKRQGKKLDAALPSSAPVSFS